MNILIISPWSDDWDINRVVGGPKIALLVKGLTENGIHVHLLIPSKKGFRRSTNSNLTLHHIPHLWIPHVKLLAPIIQLVYFLAITVCFTSAGLRLAKSQSFDLIYGISSFSSISVYLIGRKLRKPTILKLLGIIELYPPRKWSLLYWLTHITNVIAFKLSFGKLIVVDDGTYGDKAAACFGVPERRFVFHPHVINKKSASFPCPETLSKDIGFSTHDRVVMFASRHARSKRLDIVINAMALVIKNEPRARLLVIGDGPTRKKNEELAKRLGIHEYMRFVGSVRHVDVWQYYRIAHVFLSTNTLSNLCLPAVEAMACGVPVIALDIRGTGKLVKNGITGFLVQRKSDSQTSEEMADVVCRLLRDPDLHRRIADTGRTFALRNFPDWNDRIEEHIHLIESLVQSGRYAPRHGGAGMNADNQDKEFKHKELTAKIIKFF